MKLEPPSTNVVINSKCSLRIDGNQQQLSCVEVILLPFKAKAYIQEELDNRKASDDLELFLLLPHSISCAPSEANA